MKYISTTELRTRSTELIEDLKQGASVTLIHRSEVVGVIAPPKPVAKIAKADLLRKLLEANKSDKLLSQAQREEIYRNHMHSKYGGSIS